MLRTIKKFFSNINNFPNTNVNQVQLSKKEQLLSFNLEGKPFAEAMLLRVSTYQDESHEFLNDILDGIPSFTIEPDLTKTAGTAAAVLAHYITYEALESIKHTSVLLPDKTPDKHSIAAVAFSLLILARITSNLASESIKIDFQTAAVTTTNLFFTLFTKEECIKYSMQSIKSFQSIANSRSENYIEWHDNITKLVHLYVMSWKSDDQKNNDHTLIETFGKMLMSLFSTMESE